MILGCFRIGEASHPGPVEDVDQPFFLGAFNPSGLRNKAQFVSSHLAFGDIWSVSETHLGKFDLVDFRKGLHFANSPLKYCIGGSPVTSTHAWKGVAVLSRHPTRSLPHDWPSEIAESSRAMVTTSLLDDVWIHVGTVYGEPDAHSYPNHRSNNESLVTHVANRICHLMSGPRMVAGDFNEELGTLDAFAILHRSGFVDLQDIALHRWGILPRATCKGKTRKDYCFVSPELQALLLKVSVMDDVFPDHSVLVGHFRRLRHMIPKQVWPSPKQFPWPQHFEFPEDFWTSCEGTVDEHYSQLWAQIETTAAAMVPFRIPKCMHGRAQTTNVRSVWDGKFSPVKAGRPGDFQPQFHGASVRHGQWIRQCRRLQAYVRSAKSSDCQEISTYCTQVWGAILRGKGFRPNFAEWWQTCQFRTAAAPARCPNAPPACSVAQEIFDSLALAVRDLEKTLRSESKQYARLRRDANPCLIFQDLKAPGLVGADLLARSETASIIDVCQRDCCLTLSAPVEWNLSIPMFANGRQLQVIHADHDCLWLESIEGLVPGMVVAQTQCAGTIPELHEAFVNAWRKRWLRHADVPPDRWRTIIQFAQDHLPRGQFSWPSCGVVELKTAIKHKRSSTSSGLDGVSVQDLKQMPDAALGNFCRIFHEAETTGLWPSQMINGRVACLPKVAEPKSALDFRPITILGLLYRCWGSHHARHALRAVDHVLPPTLFGSRPGCFASQVWAQLMWSIEHSYSHSIELCGIVADVQKAFNFLARPVVTEVLAWIGIPLPVLVGWTGAVQAFTRRFQVRGSLSCPVPSVTGYPEGDALSCLAMVAIDWVFHVWTTKFFPLCQPITYVDDWQLLCCQPDALDQVHQVLQNFAGQVDLLLDLKKTYAWCISAKGRATLRAKGLRLEANGRNLGAHVQFTRAHANQVLTERINSVTELWGRLRRSHGAYAHKVSAVRVAAWPKALHAVASTTLGSSWFQQLRAGAMRGLSADVAGANAHVHLGMVEAPDLDPQFWAVMQTFRLARDCGSHREVRMTLGAMAVGTLDLPNNGITSTLLERIHSLGWHVSFEGRISDQFGSFSLFQVCIAELWLRASFAWNHVIAAAVAHRPGFCDVARCDPGHTRKWLRSLRTPDRVLMHKALNGTHITQDGLKYCRKVDDDVCTFCGSSDSRFHRFWVCPYFSDMRTECSADVLALVPHLPAFLTEYGWSIRASTTRQWLTMLAAIEPPTLSAFCPEGPTLQLFTDGSCVNQGVAELRFAAWAVVAAPVDDLASAMVIDCGHLPGLLQHAYRAEIFAVLRAIRAAKHFRRAAMLWSDCEGVVKRVKRILQGGLPRVNSPNYDLWVLISNEVADAKPNQFSITHVSAHRGDSAVSPLEEWCFRHNTWADRTAVRTNYARPSEFWTLFHQHASQVQAVQDISRQVQGVILAVSRTAVLDRGVSEPEQDNFEMPPAAESWKGLPELHTLPATALRWYPERMVRLILSWFLQSTYASDEEVVWVSLAQLYIAFQMATGSFGPVKKTVWCDGDDHGLHDLAGYPFRTRVRWFAKILRETLRKCGIQAVHMYGRPESNALKIHTGVLAVPWPRGQLDLVDQWLLRHLPLGVRRIASSLDRLPRAERCQEMDEIYITSM